jgi:hypothetical protein
MLTRFPDRPLPSYDDIDSSAGLLLMKLRTSTQKHSTRLKSGICSGGGRQ